jgi:3-dehydroquinate synthase
MDSGAVVHVELPSSPYDIIVRPGSLAKIGQILGGLVRARKAAVVTDSHVDPILLPALQKSLESSGFEVITAVIPAGEAHKTLAHVSPIYDRLLSSKIERSTPLLALGGGVVGDMAGFVAATILRGVPFVQVPTTLLAMVDASIGGKTGVDHATGKNLIGAFHQPIAVLADPQALRTLSPGEFRNGLAECIKHDLIRDEKGFARLETEMDSILKLEMTDLTELIAHNATIKAAVVVADPLEKGERAHLNLGHTFGHAIESVSAFAYSHGESVALGMTAATFVSRKLGTIDQSARQRIIAIIQKAGLPTSGLTLPIDDVIQTMRSDKKVKDGKLRLVLLDGIGKATVRDDVPDDLVRQAIESLR